MISADGRAGQILLNVERPAAADACNIMSQRHGYFAHTNHVLFDHNMIDNDIFKHYAKHSEPSHETEDRLQAVLKGSRTLWEAGNVSFAGLQQLFSMHPVLNVETL